MKQKLLIGGLTLFLIGMIALGVVAQQPVTINQVGANAVPVKVDGSGVTQPVSGAFWQATQPVSGTFWQATQPVSGTFWQATQPVSGTFWQATQPISAASLPLPALAATSTKQSDGSQKTQVVDASGNIQPSGDTIARGMFVNTSVATGASFATIVGDPCQLSAGITVSGSVTTSTLIITGTSAKVITLCDSTVYVNGTATNWAVVSGNGGPANAPTNATANWMGGTTAAAGPNFLANQGIVSSGPWAKFTQAAGQAGYNLYLLLSAGNQVNYNFRYVVQ